MRFLFIISECIFMYIFFKAIVDIVLVPSNYVMFEAFEENQLEADVLERIV